MRDHPNSTPRRGAHPDGVEFGTRMTSNPPRRAASNSAPGTAAATVSVDAEASRLATGIQTGAM
jgi:hypothetical protein